MDTIRGQTELTPQDREQLSQIQLAAHAALARNSLGAYCTLIEPGFETPAHIRYLIDHLEAIERGDIRRLIITMPPRHGKSYLTSGTFPLWCISRHPEWVIMLVSHSADLAETFSIQNRQTLVNNPNYRLAFPDIAISPNRRGADIWAVNSHRENLIANGIQGGLTGYGATGIIFDDLIKNAEQANSVAYKDRMWNEYRRSARTRLTPQGWMIMIATRWVEDDLIGRILDSAEGKSWQVLHLPAFSYGVESDYVRLISDESERAKKVATLPTTAYPDPLGRRIGEPLWPERWGTEFLNEQRIAQDHDFESMYQGNPGAPEGTRFKRAWFRPMPANVLAGITKKAMYRFRSYDMAWSSKKKADFTAGLRATLYVIKPPDENSPQHVIDYFATVDVPRVILVVEHLLHQKEEWDQTYEDIIETAVNDGDQYHLLLEAQAIQRIAVKSLKQDERMWKHRFHSVYTDVDKEIRAKYSEKLASKGHIYLLYPRVDTSPVWERIFLDEHGVFPNGKKDDIVDALSQLTNFLQPKIDKLLTRGAKHGWAFVFGDDTTKEKQVKDYNLNRIFNRNKRTRWVKDGLGWA